VRRKTLEVWRGAHRILAEKIGTKITLPKWFEQIAEELPVDDLRVRRYLPAFVEACTTVCLVRSFQRDRTHSDGHLEVDFADFAITALIFDHVFVESLHLGKGVGEVTRRVVETISHETGKPVRAEDMARKLNISMDTAYRKLRSAEQSGVIRLANKPEKSNRKKYWASPAPRFVPDPKKLFRKLRFKQMVKFVHPLTGEQIVYKPKE
jgi:predicted transcriptional regulator